MAKPFILSVDRPGMPCGTRVDVVEFRDLGPITEALGRYDAVLADGNVIVMIDKKRDLEPAKRRKRATAAR